MLEEPTTVILRDTAKRETERGWCWSAVTVCGRFDVLVPDPVLGQLKMETVTPFSANRSAAEDFFGRIQTAVARRIQGASVGAASPMVLALNELR